MALALTWILMMWTRPLRNGCGASKCSMTQESASSFFSLSPVLRWLVCPPGVMRTQLDRLQTVIGLERIRFGNHPNGGADWSLDAPGMRTRRSWPPGQPRCLAIPVLLQKGTIGIRLHRRSSRWREEPVYYVRPAGRSGGCPTASRSSRRRGFGSLPMLEWLSLQTSSRPWRGLTKWPVSWPWRWARYRRDAPAMRRAPSLPWRARSSRLTATRSLRRRREQVCPLQASRSAAAEL